MYTSPVTSQLTSGDPASDPTIHLRYDDPRAIHQRYVKSREDWYKAQPPGTWLGNRQYRKAMGLPLRYPKASYSWCLDYKQIGRYCKTSTGLREWTKEEMMAYLEWDKAETDRIEARVELRRPRTDDCLQAEEAWASFGRWLSGISMNKKPCILPRNWKKVVL
jgi:hypothetical protein